MTNAVSGNTNPIGGGGGIINFEKLTLTNSTVSGNDSSGSGGGILNDGGTTTLTDSTISGNSAYGIAGGGSMTLASTIVAGNGGSGAPDCSGTLTSGGYNLVGVGDGCGLTNGQNGDQVGTGSNPINPLLGPLQNNGGPTDTMALLPGSPAIDDVPASNCTLTTDQRGFTRPDDSETACDIGAYESGASAPGGGGSGGGGATATPELGSSDLLATGLLPIGAALLIRRRTRRRAQPKRERPNS